LESKRVTRVKAGSTTLRTKKKKQKQKQKILNTRIYFDKLLTNELSSGYNSAWLKAIITKMIYK
jgi:hypothetical protein